TLADKGEVEDRRRAAHRITVFDVATGHPVRTFDCSTSVSGLKYSSDGRFLAGIVWPDSNSIGKTPVLSVHIWNTETGRLQLVLHDTGHGQLAFSPDGQTLASVGSIRNAQNMPVAGEVK